MKDEYDARLWVDHHDQFTSWLGDVVDSAFAHPLRAGGALLLVVLGLTFA